MTASGLPRRYELTSLFTHRMRKSKNDIPLNMTCELWYKRRIVDRTEADDLKGVCEMLAVYMRQRILGQNAMNAYTNTVRRED